jgi:hypothetical protein
LRRQAADELGYYACYSADEIYHKDAWLLLGAAAGRTERIRLGPCVTRSTCATRRMSLRDGIADRIMVAGTPADWVEWLTRAYAPAGLNHALLSFTDPFLLKAWRTSRSQACPISSNRYGSSANTFFPTSPEIGEHRSCIARSRGRAASPSVKKRDEIGDVVVGTGRLQPGREPVDGDVARPQLAGDDGRDGLGAGDVDDRAPVA